MLDFSQAIHSLETSQSILVLPSSPADGDSLGAALALQKVLHARGKNATVVLSTEVPEVLKFLPDTEGILEEVDLNPELHITIDLRDGASVKDIQHEIVDNKVNIVVVPENGFIDHSMVSFPEPEKKFDLIVTVDTAALQQLGAFFQHHAHVFERIPSINIDHHPSNENYASINLVDTQVSSTTQLLYTLFKTWGAEMDEDVATLLLAGIITDTGSFQNANTTPEAFDISAELVELGARQQEIIKHVYKTKHLQTLKLWGRILSNIQVDEINKIVWSVVRRADFTETETTYDHIGDIIDELISNAEEAEVALLLVEKADGTLHGSIRTTLDSRDASKMASIFGGGGHVRAAGFNIANSSVNEKLPEILQVLVHNGEVANTLAQVAPEAVIASESMPASEPPVMDNESIPNSVPAAGFTPVSEIASKVEMPNETPTQSEDILQVEAATPLETPAELETETPVISDNSALERSPSLGSVETPVEEVPVMEEVVETQANEFPTSEIIQDSPQEFSQPNKGEDMAVISADSAAPDLQFNAPENSSDLNSNEEVVVQESGTIHGEDLGMSAGDTSAFNLPGMPSNEAQAEPTKSVEELARDFATKPDEGNQS